METLSKVNEQKDNVLASNTTLSPPKILARGIMARLQWMTVMFGDLESLSSGKHISENIFIPLNLYLRQILTVFSTDDVFPLCVCKTGSTINQI